MRGYTTTPERTAEILALIRAGRTQVEIVATLGVPTRTVARVLARHRSGLPTGKPRGGSKRKSFCRVIIPDSHGSLIDPGACKAFLDDLERIAPQEIVMLGDHLDCGGFLAQHHTMGYIAQTEYTFEDDCSAANQFLDAIQQRAPGAVIHYLEGNHERRIETWIVDQTVRNRADAGFLHSMFSTSRVLHLEKRGILFYPQGQVNAGTNVPAVLQLGKCRFTHGIFTNKNAAKSHVDEYVCNIVFGHTHRADSYTRRTVNDTYSAWNPGCLCVQQQFYNHSRLTHHTNGYGLQAVQGDGGFLHLEHPDYRRRFVPEAPRLSTREVAMTAEQVRHTKGTV